MWKVIIVGGGILAMVAISIIARRQARTCIVCHHYFPSVEARTRHERLAHQL